MNCPGLLFEVATAQGFYAQMTALLAGFAFTAMVILLAPAQQRGTGVDRAVGASHDGTMLSLLAALVAFVFSTLMYSGLAGEPREAQGRAVTEALLAGIPFGLAVAMLFHGITLLMRSAGVDPWAIRTARTITVVLVPTLTLYFTVIGAGYTQAIRASLRGTCALPRPPTVGVVLAAVLFVGMSVSLVLRLPPRHATRARQRLRVFTPIFSLVITIVVAVIFGDVSTRRPDLLLSESGLVGFLAGSFVVLAVVGVMLSISSADHGAGDAGPAAVVRSRPPQ